MGSSLRPLIKAGVFGIVVVLGVSEKLSGVGNMIAMERDWVPALTLATPDVVEPGYSLTHVNAIMRRIDLVCKLVAPLLISAVISLISILVGVVTVGLVGFMSWGVEILSANRVWVNLSAVA